MRPQEVYAKALRHFHLGRAIWVPEPSPVYGSIQIGDIGYMDDGQFHYLFNAALPRDHERQVYGVPNTFAVLDISDTSIIEDYLQPQVLRSRSIRQVSAGAGISGLAPTAASIQFRCSSTSGAMLVLNDTMSREIATNYRTFDTYVREHYESWYDLANNTLHRGIEDGQIILVYGCCKTSSWASAAFSNTSKNASLSICGGIICPTGDLTMSVGVDHCGSMMFRSGPVARAQGFERTKDQTVFIRAWKAAHRSTRLGKLLGLKLRAAAEPTSLGRDDPEDGSEGVPSDDNQSDDGGDFLEVIRPDYDPADALMQHILETTDCDLAIVNEGQWCNTVDEDGGHDVDVNTAQLLDDDIDVGGDTTLPSEHSNNNSQNLPIPHLESHCAENGKTKCAQNSTKDHTMGAQEARSKSTETLEGYPGVKSKNDGIVSHKEHSVLLVRDDPFYSYKSLGGEDQGRTSTKLEQTLKMTGKLRVSFIELCEPTGSPAPDKRAGDRLGEVMSVLKQSRMIYPLL